MNKYSSVKVHKEFHQKLKIEAAKLGMSIMNYLEYIHKQFKKNKGRQSITK